MMASTLNAPTAESYASGFHAVLCEDQRWARCDIKSTSLLPNVLARQGATSAGAVEAIMSRGGFVTEGAATSVAIVHAGEVHAPPEGPALLPGVTRRIAWRVAATLGIPVHERAVTVAELIGADEVLLMSSTKEIMPVVRIDDSPVGAGAPGPMWRRLFEGYQAVKLPRHAPAA
jgi:D-alanine transaminase